MFYSSSIRIRVERRLAELCVEVCGDGRTQPPEECDDGNTLANDGCFNCKVEFGATCNNQGTGTATTCTRMYCIPNFPIHSFTSHF